MVYLEIGQQQMAMLDLVAERQFVDRLLTLVVVDDDRQVSAKEPRAHCESLVQRARAYGFVMEFEIAAYVACALELGDDFDSRADWPFTSILSDTDQDPHQKAERMLAELEKFPDDADDGSGGDQKASRAETPS